MQASVRVVGIPGGPTTDAAPARGPTPRPEPGPAGPPSRPRLPAWAIELAGLALAIAFVAAVACDHALSNDELWSMAAGQWMLAHHAFIGLDPFSYTESHRHWVTDEWGSEVALAGLGRLFGSAAYEVYAVVLGAMCLAACTVYAKAAGARGGRVVSIVLLLAWGLAGTLATDRGLDFSLVWFPVELLVLTKARHDARWLLFVPPLVVAWANTHGSVLLGLAVLAVELTWSLVPLRVVTRLRAMHPSPWRLPLAATLLAAVVAACINPYGPHLLAYDLGVARDPQIAQSISEWNSPDFHRSWCCSCIACRWPSSSPACTSGGCLRWKGRWRRSSSSRRCAPSAWWCTSWWWRSAWPPSCPSARPGARWPAGGPAPPWWHWPS